MNVSSLLLAPRAEKKDVGRLREELFAFAIPLEAEFVALGENFSDGSRGQFVGAAELREFGRVHSPSRRVFIVAHCLAGDNLPDSIVLKDETNANPLRSSCATGQRTDERLAEEEPDRRRHLAQVVNPIKNTTILHAHSHPDIRTAGQINFYAST